MKVLKHGIKWYDGGECGMSWAVVKGIAAADDRYITDCLNMYERLPQPGKEYSRCPIVKRFKKDFAIVTQNHGINI